jgi:hypothetical protein
MKIIGNIAFKKINRVSPSQFHSMKNCAYKSLLAEAFEKKPFLPVSPNAYLGTVLHKKLELISSLELDDKKERTIPFVSIATFYIWTFFYYKPSYHLPFANPLIASMLLGGVVSVFMGFFINIFTKISLHSIAAGAFLGFYLSITKYTVYDTSLFLPIILIIAGMVGTARLLLRAHTLKQVLLGYFVGFFAQFLAFNVIPLIENYFN